MLVVRQVVRTDYLTSRLHRKGRYRSTIWVDVMTMTTALSRAVIVAPKAFTDVLNRFSKENHCAEGTSKMSSCEMAHYRSMLP